MRKTVRQGFTALAFTLVVAAAVFAQQAVAPDRDWDNIKHVTRKRNMAVVRHDGTCIVGRIKKVTDSSVTMLTPGGSVVATARSDVMRFEDDNEIYDVIYSARSSWYDVKAMSYNENEGLKVTARNGKVQEGRFAGATDTDVTLSAKLGKVTIAKQDVVRVEYIRIKPLSANADYLAHEGLAWMAPEVWPWYLHIGKYLTVRVYDASLPEDNSPPPCRDLPM